MLREATPSANDAVRLDAFEAAFPAEASRRREADHDEPMPPKVAGAAALRSQRVPGPDVIAAAWRGLPLAVQDQLGSTAVAFAFNAWLASDTDYPAADRWFTDAAVGQAVDRTDAALKRLAQMTASALPALFGAGGEVPDWSGIGRANPVTPFTLALAHLCEVEKARPAGLKVHDARELAAYHGLLSAPLQTRGDLVALHAYVAAPDKADDHDAWLMVWDAAIAAAEVVLRTPCAGREDAEALVRHVGWYEAEVAAIGEGRADGLTCGLRQLEARAGDLMLALGDGAGRLVA